MKLLKQLLLIFFAGLGIQKVVHDVLLWLDPGFVTSANDGYFSVTALAVLYLSVKYLKQREAGHSHQTN